MATTSQRAQNFLAKNQTNKALFLAKCPTTKETLTLPRDLQEIYADSTVTYGEYRIAGFYCESFNFTNFANSEVLAKI